MQWHTLVMRTIVYREKQWKWLWWCNWAKPWICATYKHVIWICTSLNHVLSLVLLCSIADISTVSPPGLTRSALTTSGQDGYITVTWTPSASQQGANIFCYTASDNYGCVKSKQLFSNWMDVWCFYYISETCTFYYIWTKCSQLEHKYIIYVYCGVMYCIV